MNILTFSRFLSYECKSLLKWEILLKDEMVIGIYYSTLKVCFLHSEVPCFGCDSEGLIHSSCNKLIHNKFNSQISDQKLLTKCSVSYRYENFLF